MQTGPRRKNKSSSRKKLRKRQNNLTTKTVTVQDEKYLWKNRVFGEETPLDSVVSAHPQNISLSLPTEALRSIGPFYFDIFELNPKSKVWYNKQRWGVNKSDSYIGCRRKNVK